MNRLTKKITICILSILFIFSSTVCLTLFTSNKAKAATDITFNSIAWNNTSYVAEYGYGAPAILLLYNGGVNAITDVDTDLTAELGDKITIDGTTISNITPDGSLPEIKIQSRPVSNGNAYLLIRYASSYATEGAVLHFQEATAGNANFPELQFVFTSGAWVKTATTANYKGIYSDGTTTYNMVAPSNAASRLHLALEFDKPLATAGSTELGTGNTINLTLDGVARIVANLPVRCYNDANLKNYNVLEILFKSGLGSEGTYAEGVTIQNGTKLEITDTVINGYILQDVTLYYNATTGQWQDTDTTTINYLGIYNDGTTDYNWYLHSNNTRRALILEFDKDVDSGTSGNVSELDAQSGTTNVVNITLDGKARNKTNLLARARVVVSGKNNLMELVFKTYETDGTTYTSDGTVTSPLANGTKLEITDSVVNGYTLPNIVLYFNATTQQWQDTDPTVAEQTATFSGVRTDQNNVAWEQSSDFTATFLVFENVTFTEVMGNSSTSGATGIYWINAGETEKNYFGHYWVTSSTDTIKLLNASTITIADGATLHVDAGTEFQGEVLPEVTLYMVNGTWTTEAPVLPTATFSGVRADQNNVAWEQSSDFTATFLVFENATFTEVMGNSSTSGATGIYWINAGETEKNYFGHYWVTSSTDTIKLLNASTITIADGATLHVDAGTEFQGEILPELTLYMVNGTWTTEAPAAEITFVKIDETINHYQDGEYYLTDLKFSFDTTTNAQYVWFGTAQTGYENLGEKIYWTAKNDTTKNTFNIIFGMNGNIRLMDHSTRYPTAGATITIEAGAVIEGNTLPAVTLYVTDDGTWTTEAPAPEIEFIGFDNNNYVMSDTFTLTDLKFANANFDKNYVTNGELEAGNGGEDALSKIYWTAYGSTQKNYFAYVWSVNGYLRLFDFCADFTTPYATIIIEEGTTLGGNVLPAVTLYVMEDGTWTTEEQIPVTAPMATFERVDSVDMSGTVWNMHSMLYLKFDTPLAPTTTSIHGTGQANNSGNLKYNMTIGGEPISMGTQINFYVNTFKKTEGTNTTILEIMFAYSDASTYEKGTILHIPEGTLFGDVQLSEVTLKYNGTTWIDESSLQEVTFVEIDSVRNNDNVWGMNFVTILYFDKPLYTEAYATALAEMVAGDLGTNMTLNGVTAKELNVAITFDSLSEEDRYGLEIHIPVENMPELSEELNQIILKIEEGTIFLTNILPELTLYLNDEYAYQTSEFTYVYVAPIPVYLVNLDPRYNIDNNSWQTVGEWYLSVLQFSNYVTKKYIGGSSQPLGDVITLNGVKTSELGFLYGISAYSKRMNVQYPKDALLSLLDEPRVVLELNEAVEYGDSIIQPFKLYLHKITMRWEPVDLTDTNAPEITYNGATEIVSSEGKPFVIDISAFDNEDNTSPAIYYNWSKGALDSSGNLKKGTHTCTVVAIDKAGNETELVLTVIVGDKDVTAPLINVADTIVVTQGSIPELTFKAIDDFDGEILCEITWSEGALDADGKLLAGTHKITLTATDLTGNVATKDISVNVLNISLADLEEAKGTSGCNDSLGSCATLIFLAMVGATAFVFRRRRAK